MAANAFVSWLIRDQPWELEDELLAAVDLPLNLLVNSHNRFQTKLSAVRAQCVEQARSLPIVPNPASARDA